MTELHSDLQITDHDRVGFLQQKFEAVWEDAKHAKMMRRT